MVQHLQLPMDDEVIIHLNHWHGNKDCKAVILLLHGMAEHSARYHEFSERLLEEGYVIYAPDHRGHGQTGKTMDSLGFFQKEKGWSRVVTDIYEITKWIKKRHPQQKLFLIGHSMGSLLARTAIAKYGHLYDGVILSGTTLGGSKLKLRVGDALTRLYIRSKGPKKVANLLDNMTFGSFNKRFRPNETSFDWLSRDKERVKAYIDDDCCGFICTASFFKDLLDGTELTKKKAMIEAIPKTLPVYIFCGEHDPVSNGAKEVKRLYDIYERTGIHDVKIKIYKEGRHEMLNEINRQDVYRHIIEWLNGHL